MLGYDAYDVGPLSEGWRYQRDTAAYVQPSAVPSSEYAMWPGRQVTPEMVKEKLDAAVRYREMRGRGSLVSGVSPQPPSKTSRTP